MEKNLEIIRDSVNRIATVEKLEYIESDKIEVVVQISEEDDQSKIKDAIIRLLKIDYKIPKVKYSVNIIKLELSLATAKKIIVSSGKGGVGKSNVTASIANELSNQGKKVAIIDADIYGSSIPMLFGLEISPKSDGKKVFPLKHNNIELIGTTNVNPNNEPVVWRGPMLGRLLKSFFNDVYWSEDIEYLLIDLPPGTGDIPLDLNELIPDAKCIVVTTPHQNASKVAIKAGEMAKMQKHELIGVIENMSYYNHSGEKLYIFGKDGGQLVADKLNTSLITKVPIINPDSTDLLDNDETKESYKTVVNTILNKF